MYAYPVTASCVFLPNDFLKTKSTCTPCLLSMTEVPRDFLRADLNSDLREPADEHPNFLLPLGGQLSGLRWAHEIKPSRSGYLFMDLPSTDFLPSNV